MLPTRDSTLRFVCFAQPINKMKYILFHSIMWEKLKIWNLLKGKGQKDSPFLNFLPNTYRHAKGYKSFVTKPLKDINKLHRLFWDISCSHFLVELLSRPLLHPFGYNTNVGPKKEKFIFPHIFSPLQSTHFLENPASH